MNTAASVCSDIQFAELRSWLVKIDTAIQNLQVGTASSRTAHTEPGKFMPFAERSRYCRCF